MGAQWKAKHKDLAANAKGRLFGKLAKEIMIAASALLAGCEILYSEDMHAGLRIADRLTVLSPFEGRSH